MSPLKTYKYRECVRKLRAHDKLFQEWASRGKGSHRIIYHPSILGKPASYPLPFHGAGGDVRDCYLQGLIRRFNLPADFF